MNAKSQTMAAKLDMAKARKDNSTLLEQRRQTESDLEANAAHEL